MGLHGSGFCMKYDRDMAKGEPFAAVTDDSRWVVSMMTVNRVVGRNGRKFTGYNAS